MKFKYISGKNHKHFVQVSDIETKDDLKVYEIVKSVLFRKEYNPFIKSSFKTIEYSYLFDNSIFPLTFWADIKQTLLKLNGAYIKKEDVVLEGDPYLPPEAVFPQIPQQDFDLFISSLKLPPDISIDKEEYAYQTQAVFAALNTRTGRIEVATSGGKTLITYIYVKALLHASFIKRDPDKKILIVVPSQLLCTQLKRDFSHYSSNDTPILIETIFSGSRRIANAQVVCGTYQSLSKYDDDYFDDFDTLVCDELHRAKSWSIRINIYAKMRFCEYVFGMTGSFPKRESLDYLHITAIFGQELLNVSARQLIDAGVANNVKIHQIKIEYYLTSPPSPKRVYDIYDIIEKPDPDQDLAERGAAKYAAEKAFFQSNEQRTDIIKKLLSTFKQNSIIFTDTVEYCDVLFSHLSTRLQTHTFSIIHGKVQHRDEILDAMRAATDSYVIIATFATMSTGISIKNLTNAYIVDSGKSEIRIRQSIGRLMRILEGKSEGKIFDFYDCINNSTFCKHAKERATIYSNHNFEVKIHNAKILLPPAN